MTAASTRLDVSGVPPQGAYVAKRCPVRIQFDHEAGAGDLVRIAPTEADQVRMQEGLRFEADIFARLVAAHPLAAIPASASRTEMQRETVRLMRSGATLLLGGDLPDDVVGRRTGKPDVLVRVPGSPGPSWLPVDIKHHSFTESTSGSSVRCSSLDGQLDPDHASVVDGVRFRRNRLRDDAFQLAHYWRMLEAIGMTPSDTSPTGGIIDRDATLWWVDLSERIWKLWWADDLVSTMDWYDYEFAFRLDVVAHTTARNQDPTMPRKVVPVWTAECGACPWRGECREELEAADHVSLLPRSTYAQFVEHRRRSRLTRRTIAELDWTTAWVMQGDRAGGTKVDVAAVIASASEMQPAAAVVDVVGKRKKTALARLEAVGIADAAGIGRLDVATASYGDAAVNHLPTLIDEARSVVSGSPCRRRGVDAVVVPRADVEVDVDMESCPDGVYLWGTATTRVGQEGVDFRPFATWEPLTSASEVAVFLEFWTWIQQLRADAHAAGQSFAAYCYTSAENTQMRRIVTSVGEALPTRAEVESFIASDEWIDLHQVFTSQVVTGRGGGLKVVAPLAGFCWRDPDPGGDQSTVWYARAVEVAGSLDAAGDAAGNSVTASSLRSPEEHRERLLRYNEDDVLATRAIRHWLACASLASVEDWKPG